MKKTRMKIKSIIFSSAILCLTSCGFLDVEPKIICTENFYNTQEEVLYGLTGVYGVMNNESFYGNYYSLMCSNIDDLSYYNRPTTSNYTQVYRHDATSTEIYGAWTEIYKGIKNANAFMEAVSQTEFDSDRKYYSEARFLRAYYHFLLAQAWGDVPLKTKADTSAEELMCEATPQYEVLKWAASEMEECLEFIGSDLTSSPSRINGNVVKGILSRVYLFMAGKSVKTTDSERKACYKLAMNHAYDIIKEGKHQLNPDYSRVFINMIEDKYDTEFHESMWEAEFLGNRQSADSWSNGRIGDLIGLQSSGSSDYSSFACNYSYAQYDGSLKLWDLYWKEDLPEDQKALAKKVTDKRQLWNMPPYNYAGSSVKLTYKDMSGVDSVATVQMEPSIMKSPYSYGNRISDTSSISLNANNRNLYDPLAGAGIRNCGKWRREVQYEGVMDSKRLYTGINFPILRYSDVLLMYAEASLEYEGTVLKEAYDCVAEVRTRAGVKTKPFSDYDVNSFRQLVRNERGRELCFEALRKYDLIRWGEFVKEMNAYSEWATDPRWKNSSKSTYAANIGETVQDKHILLPIPSIELGVNKSLKQNPLW